MKNYFIVALLASIMNVNISYAVNDFEVGYKVSLLNLRKILLQ